MTSGSSADTTMTFGGEVAMPAASESTAEETQTISVDSVTTEEEKKPRKQSTASSSRQRASSLPKTKSQTRSLSTGHSAKASDGRPSKSAIQSRQTIKKVKDREPLSSPEQPKSRSSSRSASQEPCWTDNRLLLRLRNDRLSLHLCLRLRVQKSRTSTRATRPMLHWKGQYEFKVNEGCEAIFRC